MEVFSTGNSYLKLGVFALDVESCGNNREAFLLNGLGEPQDLPFVEEESPFADGIVVENIAVSVGANMHSMHPGLPIPNEDKTILEVDGVFSDGLDFCAGEFDTSFVGVQYIIVMESLAVDSDFNNRFFGLAHSRSLVDMAVFGVR